jgi:hypothetical protein
MKSANALIFCCKTAGVVAYAGEKEILSRLLEEPSMSDPMRISSGPQRTELETVTNWPLIVGGLMVVVVPALFIAGLALFSALRTPRDAAVLPVARTEAPGSVREGRPVVGRSAPEVVPEAVSTVKIIPVRQPAPWPEPRPEQAAKPGVDRPTRKFVEYRRSTEEQVRAGLEKVPELDVRAEKDGSDLLYRAYFTPGRTVPDPDKPLVAYLATRPDLTGLPLRLGGSCRTTADATRLLGAISKTLRPLQARRDLENDEERPLRPGEDPHRRAAMWAMLGVLHHHKTAWSKEPAVGALEQMLEVDSPRFRMALVKFLADIEGEKATETLARRAVFDFSAEIRREAVGALRDRPAEQVRPVLLSALRHPWAPAADHAAEALAALGDRKAVPALEDLLKQDDPCAATREKDGKWVRQELVRVNHLRNCLLCHPPSRSEDDPVRGPIPTPGSPLPEIYYDRGFPGQTIRADITFLKQDFSTFQHVADADRWPVTQRFDFFVRTRPATAAEVKAQLDRQTTPAEKGKPSSYSQRDAVAWALAELKKAEK